MKALLLCGITTLTLTCGQSSFAKDATEEDAIQVASMVSKKPLGAKHQKIEVVKAESDSLTFNLWYSQMPGSYDEVERDTKGVVEYARKIWLEKGLDIPQFIFQVACRGFKQEPGDRVRTMGTAYWDGDSIYFKKR